VSSNNSAASILFIVNYDPHNLLIKPECVSLRFHLLQTIRYILSYENYKSLGLNRAL